MEKCFIRFFVLPSKSKPKYEICCTWREKERYTEREREEDREESMTGKERERKEDGGRDRGIE